MRKVDEEARHHRIVRIGQRRPRCPAGARGLPITKAQLLPYQQLTGEDFAEGVAAAVADAKAKQDNGTDGVDVTKAIPQCAPVARPERFAPASDARHRWCACRKARKGPQHLREFLRSHTGLDEVRCLRPRSIGQQAWSGH